MDFLKKILIAIITIILTYSLWRLINRRNEIRKTVEGATTLSSVVPSIVSGTNPDKELVTLDKSSSNPVSIKNINPKYANILLKEYCIKASYNSAYTGNYVNLDMITYVLSRGCRYLDFEVFYVTQKNLQIPVVSVSIDPNYATLTTQMTPPENRFILLDTVLSKAASSGFSDTSPNNGDPLFINLRIKSTDPNVYQSIAKSIQATIQKSRLFKGKIKDSTTLSDILGKIVLIIDKTININYLTYAECNDPADKNCYKLSDQLNLESGGQLMALSHYSDVSNRCYTPIKLNDDNLTTNSQQMNLLNPDMVSNQKTNIYFNPMVYNYGFQVIPYLFYYNDSNLDNYETFFNKNSSAFVQLSIAIPYFQKLSQTTMQKVNL